MGYITNLLKGGANSALNSLKNYDAVGKINSGLSTAGLDFEIPKKVELPETTKDWKLNIDPSVVKLPAGVDSYISPVLKKVGANVKLPSEIEGAPIPEMPDLSSVSAEVDNYLSGIGFDTNKLGIPSVSDILETPNLSALKKVEFEPLVDTNNMPDITSIMDDFDLSEAQQSIDTITSSLPSMKSIDISKYF